MRVHIAGDPRRIGTVRYVGVDWDGDDDGKQDGSVAGVRYFAPGLPDPGRSSGRGACAEGYRFTRRSSADTEDTIPRKKKDFSLAFECFQIEEEAYFNQGSLKIGLRGVTLD
ncbi:hypothetical protein QJS10_CPA08g00878 [Acorus calamus]|uniref:CAP-Gly domain-containing protein n=1 Tax=Acorus calamus TaxID=4465 RepID=A0AAV9EE96_ACOCL|nr:hypothetical protein QJS10_CPA08g00878 [Acorus calamus]